MQFQSIGAQGNYAQAGKSAANDTLRSFLAQRNKSPDYGQLAMDAAEIRSKEKQATVAAESQVAQAGIAASAKVDANQIKLDGNMAYKKGKRMAGVLSAGGQMVAKAGELYGNADRKLRETGEYDSYYDKQKTRAQGKLDEANADLDKYSKPIELETAPTPGGSTDTDGGLVATATPAPKTVSGGGGGWQRLSKVLRHGEGTTGDAGYTTQFTGTQFSDMSKHPRQIRSTNGLSSDAAGAYQFLSTTWDEAKSALNLPDFSRDSQEKAGRFLTERRGVNPDQVFKTKAEFKSAMDKLAPEWASMPYSGKGVNGGGYGSSYYGQGGISLDKAWSLYNS